MIILIPAEFALIASLSVAGAISAVAIDKFSRAREIERNERPQHPKLPSVARAELISLMFEKSITSEAITRVYEAAQQDRIDRLERDRLLLKYKQQLDSLNQRITHLRPVADYSDLSDFRNKLARLLEDKISLLDQRLLEISKSGILADADPKVEKIFKETTKMKAAAVEHKPFKEEEKSIEQLQNEIMEALQRLEQVEIDKE
jgi:hypothetical protein